MAVTAPKSSLSSIANQAKLESFVKYDPEKSALSAMLRQAITERDAAINAAVATNRGMQSAIGAARPELKHSYDYAGKAIAGTQATLDTKLSSLGAAAAPFEAAIAAERTGAGQRTVESEANALKDLSNRRIQSAASVGQARVGALSKFANDTNQIENRALDLANEEGAFAQARTGELQKEQVDRGVKTQIANMEESGRNSRSRAGIRVREQSNAEHQRHDQAIENGKGKGTKQTQSAIHLYRNVHNAVLEIRGLKKQAPNITDAEIETVLTSPRNAKNPHGGYSPDEFSAAHDLATSRYLSPANARNLRRAGVRIPKDWLPPKAGTPAGLTQTATQGVQQIANAIHLPNLGG